MADDENDAQGFNDSELADIMQEIESLETESQSIKENNEEDELIAKLDKETNDDSDLGSEEDLSSSLDEVSKELEELEKDFSSNLNNSPTVESSTSFQPVDSPSSMKRDSTLPSTGSSSQKSAPVAKSSIQRNKGHNMNAAPQLSIVDKPESSNSNSTRMEFAVEGNMQLNLAFKIGDQSVSLSVCQDDGLVIGLPGGGKFIIPLDK